MLPVATGGVKVSTLPGVVTGAALPAAFVAVTVTAMVCVSYSSCGTHAGSVETATPSALITTVGRAFSMSDQTPVLICMGTPMIGSPTMNGASLMTGMEPGSVASGTSSGNGRLHTPSTRQRTASRAVAGGVAKKSLTGNCVVRSCAGTILRRLSPLLTISMRSASAGIALTVTVIWPDRLVTTTSAVSAGGSGWRAP